MAKKEIDYMKTIFKVEVKDTHIYDHEDGIKELQTKTNLGGVYYDAIQIGSNPVIFEITSRPHFPKYAIKDHFFLIRSFERNFGRVYDIQILARGTRIRDTEYDIPYIIEGNMMKPKNEWQQSYQTFDLQY